MLEEEWDRAEQAVYEVALPFLWRACKWSASSEATGPAADGIGSANGFYLPDWHQLMTWPAPATACSGLRLPSDRCVMQARRACAT